jgi:transcriptional regulator with XRE-family HTH domain
VSINESDILKKFGEKVRKLRKEKGLSMQALANIAEIELSQVYRIETAKINPKFLTIYRVARALEVDPKDLLV